VLDNTIQALDNTIQVLDNTIQVLDNTIQVLDITMQGWKPVLLKAVLLFLSPVLETQPYPLILTRTQGTSGGQEGQITS
jgi:hypothetical protein